MNVIFLDVDGVLNNSLTKEMTPDKYIGIDDELVENLAKIVKATNSKIVLTSDWKDDWINRKPDGLYLDEKLAKEDLTILTRTYETASCFRGEGIRTFLANNEVDNYVILDDHEFTDFKDELKEHFIWVHPKFGLTEQHINLAISKLNGTK